MGTGKYPYKSEAARRQATAVYDAVLAKWPVAYTTRIVPTPLGNTHLIQCGDASKPPLILLHGGANNATFWFYNVAELGQHFALYVVDTVGEPGKSEAPLQSGYKDDGYVRWLAAVMDELNRPQANLAGLSQGGDIALRFALQYPQRVNRAVFLEPAFIAKMRLAFLLRAVFSFAVYPTIHRTRKFVYWGSSPANRPIRDEAWNLQNMVGFLRGYQLSMARPPGLITNDQLQSLSVPSLFLFGDHEALYAEPGDQIRARINKNAPLATCQVVAQSGHAINMERPLLTNQLILSFLQSVNGRGEITERSW